MADDGIGSAGNETAQHFAALKNAERQGHEPPGTHDAAVADIWKRDPKRAKALGLPQPKERASVVPLR